MGYFEAELERSDGMDRFRVNQPDRPIARECSFVHMTGDGSASSEWRRRGNDSGKVISQTT